MTLEDVENDEEETGNSLEASQSGAETARSRRTRAGAMERQLKRDLRGLGTSSGTFHGTFAQLALAYARALDGDSEEPPSPGDIARLGQQLRATLAVLSGKGGALDQSVADQISELLSAKMGNGKNT
jgi:hypothetical protein